MTSCPSNDDSDLITWVGDVAGYRASAGGEEKNREQERPLNHVRVLEILHLSYSIAATTRARSTLDNSVPSTRRRTFATSK